MRSKSHHKYSDKHRSGRFPQRKSVRLLFNALSPHQRNNYQRERVTPPRICNIMVSKFADALLSAEVSVSVFFPFLRIVAMKFYVAVIGFR